MQHSTDTLPKTIDFSLFQLPSLIRCTVSHDGVRKGLLRFISSDEMGGTREPVWSLHAWATLILPWEKQIVTQTEKGRNRWCDSASQAVTPTDWLASVIVVPKKKKFYANKVRDVTPALSWGTLSSCIFSYPAAQRMPCGRWRRDSVATRITEKWCWL